MAQPRAIVIGGGHNGLIASIKLAEAGFKVTLIEARGKVGGMLDTVEVAGGRVSRLAYVIGLMPREFLEKYKIPVIRQDPFQVIKVGNRVIPFWRDRERRIRELLKAGEVKFPEFEDKLFKFKELIYRRFTFTDNPPSLSEVREEAVKAGVEEFIDETCSKLLSEYLSEDLHYAFMYPGMENSPAYLIAYYYTTDWSFVRGGMGSVADALAKYARGVGVDIRLNAKARSIIVSGDEVKGVETDAGVLEADVVLAAVSPATLDELLGGRLRYPKPPRPGWRKYNIVLRDYPRMPEELKPYAHSILDTEAGELVIPSILDDTRGRPVFEFMGSLELLMEEFQGLRDNAIAIDVADPSVAEREYNVPNGDVNHIPMRMPYLFNGRPGYRTGIRGLYLGSAGSYPGGQVTGIPGFNAALAVAKDYGRSLSFP